MKKRSFCGLVALMLLVVSFGGAEEVKNMAFYLKNPLITKQELDKCGENEKLTNQKCQMLGKARDLLMKKKQENEEWHEVQYYVKKQDEADRLGMMLDGQYK